MNLNNVFVIGLAIAVGFALICFFYCWIKIKGLFVKPKKDDHDDDGGTWIDSFMDIMKIVIIGLAVMAMTSCRPARPDPPAFFSWKADGIDLWDLNTGKGLYWAFPGGSDQVGRVGDTLRIPRRVGRHWEQHLAVIQKIDSL